MVMCGRKWGKTELIIYILWRWAQSNPGAGCYYLSPFIKQTKEIVWANRRAQDFGPHEWIQSINNSEMRINLKNKSFIKFDGSDNFEAYRGIEPSIVVLEEFKDFRPEFYPAMEPNLAVYQAPIIIIGTPPDRECQYMDIAKQFRESPDKILFHGTSWENPHIDRNWLIAKRKELYDRGESDVWLREYEAQYIPGGVSKIFPMFNKTIIRKHEHLIREIDRDKRKLEWFCVADPAASTIFGVLFLAFNQFTKVFYVLGEVYESDQSAMSVNVIGSRILALRNALWSRGEWRNVCDEAETWFRNEMLDRFQEFFEPTHKHLKSKEDGLSILKDMMLQGKLVVSDSCEKLIWELDNYYKDKKGNIPKNNDHLIDCLRYAVGAANYSLNPEQDPETAKDWFKISDDFQSLDEFGEIKEDQWLF